MARSTLWLLLFAAPAAVFAEPPRLTSELVERIGREDVVLDPVGRTGEGVPFHAIVHRDDFDFHAPRTRILLVGNSAAASRMIGEALVWFYTHDDAKPLRKDFLLSAVPHMTPGADKPPPGEFPPAGEAYTDPISPQTHYLWRWIGMHAPDLVVVVHAGEGASWFVPSAEGLPQARLASALAPWANGEKGELAAALVRVAPCETGRIAAVRATAREEASPAFLRPLFDALRSGEGIGPSPARRELRTRLDRSPVGVARVLSEHYGQTLPQVVYIPAMALVGRLRLGEATADTSHAAEIRQIVAPYFDGARPTKPDSGSALAGHLIFTELGERSRGAERERYVQLARRAADQAFDENGAMREAMPYHLEMSDALFMGGPILAHLGKLTGEARYFDACANHLRYMRQRVLREDGLYRHSPLDEAAWGRGNGFPALGLALCLSHWPQNRADREELLAMFRDHLAALKPHQDRSGAWRQVIDRPDSYRELTCTCMIAFAAARGVRKGWLDRGEYDPLIQRAWTAIRLRVAAKGRLVDVCTGTGKQPSLEDYYRRTAILGRDDRGGAMALLAATEMMAYEKTP